MSTNSMDSPVRKQHTCIACGGSKSDSTLICWPCHRVQKLRNQGGYSDRLETLLNLVDGGHITVAEAVTRYANS